MMVDLGASHSVLLELDSVNKIQLPEKYLSSSLGRGLGGELSGYVGRINSLTIGKFSFRNLIASFTGNYRSQKDVNENDRNGTIGGEILGRFNVIFDYFNRKLYLRKNINYRRSFEFDMSGIEVIAQNYFPVIFEITDVRINSPAELAGILPGDIITRINGKNPEELTLEQVHEILCSGGNRKIRLDIIRNGNIIKTKFRLKKLI
jgi:C-terminal processing protease CtpA/Prc